MTLLPRFIEPKILDLLRVSPVVILEGARAVGKTSLVQKLRKDGHLKAVYSMADFGLRSLVEADPVGWLRSLDWPCAIDEAQLVPQLPLAIKQVLDETQDGISLLLTGSSSIGQSGFGGTDPLARRALRLSLEPLSEAEIAQSQPTCSLADALFSATPVTNHDVEPLKADSAPVLRGGMPQYRLSSQTGKYLGHSIDEGIRSILTQKVKPGESFDQIRAYEILSYLLRHPASELNISEIGRELGMDRRTVDSYIDALEKRFLIYEVPNLHRQSKRSLRSNAKFFPADIALSAHALAAKSDVSLSAPDVSGRLIETFAMQQLRAHVGWAASPLEIFHWRQNFKGKTLEVDAVLRDSSGALVALEIKSAARVKPEYLKGLKAFREAYATDFKRGFVVCNVKQPLPLGEDLWAIPFESLSNPGLWQGMSWDASTELAKSQPDYSVESSHEEFVPVEFELVASFSAADAQSLVAGNMLGFVQDLADAVESLYGYRVGLVLSDGSASLADRLERKQDDARSVPRVFLALLTPRLVRSGQLLTDLHAFEASLGQGGEASIFTAKWLNLPASLLEAADAQTLELVQAAGQYDLSAARRAERSSVEYRLAVEELAQALGL